MKMRELIIVLIIYVICNAAASETETSSIQGQTESQLKLEEAKNGLANFTLTFQGCAIKNVDTDKNVLFSPVNIAVILATILLGAEGDTKNELLNVLGVTAGKDLSDKEIQVHLALGHLFQEFIKEGASNPATKVEISEGMFVGNNSEVREQFKKLSKTYYANEIANIDFTKENSVDIINKWVENRTNERIKNLLKQPIDSNTKLILLNTIFFDGEWQYPFFTNTTWKTFNGRKGTYDVKMMFAKEPVCRYVDSTRGYEIIGIPYKGGNIVMFVILPDSNHKLEDVLAKLTVQELREIPRICKIEETTYEIPYMKIGEELNLVDILRTMGIKSIFEANANLTNIADDVYVSKAIHKVNLDVTEAGSTGSAATAVHIDTRFPEEPFIVDKPFSFFIYHNSSELISFWGSINVPIPNQNFKPYS